MKYDDASWHYGGEFPAGLPEIGAAIHTGMFLAWAIHNDMAGEIHSKEWPEELDAVKRRLKTGAEFLMSVCDEKFTDEDLNDVGNRFASSFYEKDYFDKYLDAADPEEKYESVYEIPDTWEIYDAVAKMLDHEFSKWNLART